MNQLNRPVLKRLAVATAALAVTALAVGCSRAGNPPIIRYQVRLEADARTPEACNENVAVRFAPVSVSPQVPGNLYQMTAFSDESVITGKPTRAGPEDWECWHTYTSPALSPGKWKVVGEFSSGSQSCLRDVGPGKPNRVSIDQEDGCVEVEAPASPDVSKSP
jgi:hypothetical protein